MMWFCCRSRLRIRRAAKTCSGSADIESGTLALGANASIAQSFEPESDIQFKISGLYHRDTKNTEVWENDAKHFKMLLRELRALCVSVVKLLGTHFLRRAVRPARPRPGHRTPLVSPLISFIIQGTTGWRK